ncbi:hypothetical protein Golob_002999 [Gossypium lobatum]|uniref:ATP phosphoribosyltransferase n=1 Tax=Gossypium lobatum TaxID=34289 RepID=A0A7J8N6Y3_9ROSI|nr:hypothetical protein [Gossypium lobatum]
MGIADAILDLVSSGTTLRENNLKEIEGGVVLESQAVLVASRKALIQRKGALDTTHEILERFEAHLRAADQFMVTANMRGSSAEEVAERVLSQPSLSGLQGPTLSPVLCKRDGKVAADYYAIVICVPKKALYKSVQQLRAWSANFTIDLHFRRRDPKMERTALEAWSLVFYDEYMGALLAFHIRSFEVLRYQGGLETTLVRVRTSKSFVL